MSKIQAIPFIQAVLVTFTPEQQATLVSLINGSNKQPAFRSLINPNHMITISDKGVNHVTLETRDRVFTGYLLYNNSYCVLLAYAKDTQNLVMVDIDLEAQDYRTVEESLTILELRFSLEDAKEPTDIVGTVQSAINSGAIDVKAIENIENTGVNDGTVVKMIGFDSEGNLVEGVVSEGQVVDQVLDSTSTNAVGNAPVTTAIEGLQSDISDIETALDTKANISALENGTLVPAKSLTSKQLENISDESGSTQDVPFLFQATGTENNTTETPTAPIAKHLELRGNTIAWNQLAREMNSTYWFAHANGSVSFSDGVATYTVESLGTYVLQNRIGLKDGYDVQCVAGHKYLCIFKFKALHSGQAGFMLNAPTSAEFHTDVVAGWNVVGGIVTCAHTGGNKLLLGFETQTAGYEVGDEVQFTDCILIDLTQIGKDAYYTSVAKFKNDFPEDYYAYNAGTLKNCASKELVTIGYNQWDEEWELGGIDSTTGEDLDSQTDRIRSKNYIPVLPNTSYYFKSDVAGSRFYYDADKNFISAQTGSANYQGTTPANCRYMRIILVETSYIEKACIFLYWDGSRIGYEPYEKHTYALPTDILKSAGSAYDEIKADGTKVIRTTEEDFSDWSLTYDGTYFAITSQIWVNMVKKPASNNDLGNFITNAPYDKRTRNNMADQAICLQQNGALLFRDDSKTDADLVDGKAPWLAGKKIIVELAEPVESETTSFAENIVVDDFGTMQFIPVDDATDPIVPQGNQFFYPADYVLLIDDLNNYTNGSVDKLALKTDLGIVEEKIGAKLPECPTDTDGTYVLKAVVADGEVTYSWVAEEA